MTNLQANYATQRYVEVTEFGISELSHQRSLSKTVVVFDPTVNNYHVLIEGVNPQADVIVLDAARDGVIQITEALQKYTEIETLHIVCHGSPGSLKLGSTELSLHSLNKYNTQLQKWSIPLCQSSLLIYGCNVAAGDVGKRFVKQLHQLTGSKIAASAKSTGSAALGGDWNLEVTVGEFTPCLAFCEATREAYNFVLADELFESDDFNGYILDKRWTFVDLLGDGSYALTGTGTDDAYLELSVPGGTSHDIWNGNQTVRMMQGTANEDFTAEVKFDSQPSQGYQMQGIIVEQDADNWLRFDTYHDGSTQYIFAATTTGGRSGRKIEIPVTSTDASYLRVNRQGNTWTLEYSGDGINWITAGSFEHTLNVSEVGVFAGNAGRNSPAYTAVVDYFFNTAAPIVPEDGVVANAPPVTNSDAVSVLGGNTVDIRVLNNDKDFDGELDATTLVATNPVNGSINVDSTTGIVSYTPNSNFIGTDTFTYTVADNEGNISDPTTVSIAVHGEGSIVFPGDAGVIDVRTYGAIANDGIDDTAAIQQALDANPGGNRIIYLPNGVYDVSDQLRFAGNQKRNILQGESRDGTIIRLADNSGLNSSVIWTGNPPAQRFRNAIRDLTLSIGNDNPNATGVNFIANNQGTLNNVTIISEDGQGNIGLDLGTDENGPALISDVEVVGFDVGIRTWNPTASLTLEHIRLENQNEYGWQNFNQTVFVRDLQSINEVTAVWNMPDGSSIFTLLDSTLTGVGAASSLSAIHNQKGLYVRNLTTSGYDLAILQDDKGRGNPSQPDGFVEEWLADGEFVSLFDSPKTLLNLPIAETPEVVWDDISNWSSPTAFGGVANDGIDDTAAIQAAIDSGATTVYLANGTWDINGTVELRGNVQRFLGTEARINSTGEGLIQVGDGSAEVVFIERLEAGEISFVHDSDRTLVLSSMFVGSYTNTSQGTGDLHIEDVGGGPWVFTNQNVWARQINPEVPGTRIVNDGGNLWILGYKTEIEGTLIETINGGNTELIGAYILNGNFGSTPAFINNESSLSYTNVMFRTFNGGSVPIGVQETQNGVTQTTDGLPVYYTGYAGVDEVPSANNNPVANNDSASVTVGGAIAINVLSNDSDSDGTLNPNSVNIASQPSSGEVTVNPDGTITYTHNGSPTATDSFTYTVADNDGDASNIATVDITVTPNQVPVANNDSASVTVGGAIAINVLSNDSDSDGTLNPNSVNIASQPSSGEVTVNPDGTITYTHNGSASATDSFTYTVADNNGDTSNPATVDLTVVTLPETFASDDFNSANLNPIWTFADPVGDSNYALTGVGTEDAYLELAVAGGNSHDMWFSQNQAVRVMQGTANEDFTAEVKFESQPSQGYQIQGILVQEDANNWLRFDVYHDGSTQNIFAAATNSGNSGVKINSSISFADASYLRVNRQGNTWTLDYSGDGITWTTAGNFNHTINVSEIGVFAGNAGGNSPAYTAVVDYFFNSATPIVPEDVAPANQPPVANDDIVSVEPGETKTINVLNNDTDADGTTDPNSITIVTQPLNGTVIVGNDGVITYSHNGSATATDSFTYTVADNDGDTSNIATVDITVTPNQVPVANNDSASVTVGGAIAINVLSNDSDSDGTLNPNTVNIASQPSNGSVIVNPDGTITYTHNGSASATDSFTYTVTDNDGDTSNTATVDITVTPNQVPVANNDSASVTVGGAIAINVLSNDSDSDGTLNPNSVNIASQPSSGSVTVNPDGTITYTHNGSPTATDSFTYTVADNDADTSNIATVDITVTPNQVPVANNDSASVTVGGAIAINVLSNDSDSDGTLNPNTVNIASQPSNGSVIVNPDGTITYTHNGSASTTDTFTYTVADNDADTSNIATVDITVTPNQVPVANNDSASVTVGGAIAINVLSNDSDSDGTLNPNSVNIASQPSSGEVTVNPDGTITYTHNGSASATDSFTYTVADNNGDTSNPATVDLTVVTLPETFASDDFNSANLNPIWTFADPVGDSNYALTGVGTEDAYLELAVAGGNSHDMWFSQNQAVRVMQGTANEDFTAEVKFESQPSQGYQIQGILVQEDANNWLRFDVYHDGSTQNIFAAATNSGNSGVKINSSISFADASYLRVNRQGNTWTLDYSGDGITWTTAGNFNHTINVSEIGVFAGNAGGNSPAYTAVVDYFFNSATPIVPEDVAPANQPPVANDDIVSVEPGETKTLDILSNDTDSDGSVAPSTITIIDQPLNGTVIPNNDGTVTYSHNGSATTSDTFTYTVADNDGDISNTATVNLTIAPNQAPTANNDTAVVTTGDTLTINILNNDTDSDGNLDLTTLTIASQPSSGSVTVNPDGTITYTHNGSATTTDTFTYTVADDDADPSNIATVDITVTPNQVPVANNDSASVTSGGAIAINVLNNDSDSDGTLNPNTVNITSQPSNGSVIVNSNGTITYTHNGSATTPDTFTYTVADNDGSTSNPATVDVNIITQSSGGPFIDLWHGSVQEFGQNGQPQNWINILGNVNDPDGVASLSYSLNGSSPVSLNYQANGLRLANNGDFNVDIAYSLLDGSAVDDIVTITAVDELGNVSTQTVTVDYQTPTSVSENYSIDWNSVNNPLDVGQPIDGKWGIEGDGIRTLETGYDRLYGFGDISWDNYEVEAAITINQFNFAGGSGVGFLLRWNGHTDNSDDPQDLEQPIAGFYPLGGIGWYTGNGLQIFTDDGKNSAAKSLQEGNTYIFKMRVEDVESTDRTLYSLKVWDEGEAEPTNWDVQESSSSGPDSGGAVLIAHRNDVTFGDVTVTPISGSANQFSSQNSTSNNTNNTSTNNGETQSSTIRINAGGNEYTDVFGRHWLADTYYNGGKVHNAGLEANADTSEVSLYGTERWEPQFSYQIPVANGTYDVNLSWLENYHNTIGDRLIDVVIEGQLVQDNLDVFAEVGLNKLLTKSFQDIQITDGELTIEFIDQSPDSNAFVLAIEILPDSGTIPSKTIIADTNSNTLSATEGDDTLIGVNPNASNPGQGEIDTFTGLGGADTFVLGDTIQTYYDDGLINTAGVDDYALISDFNIEQQDVIQLSGTSTDYLLGTSPNGLANGQGIFRQVSGQENELIGIVEGVTGLTLNSPSFQFV